MNAVSNSPGFIFHVKAFGMFTSGNVSLSFLPQEIRMFLPPSLINQLDQYKANNKHNVTSHSSNSNNIKEPSVSIAQLGINGVQALWDNFHQSLQPFIDHHHMGCVVFQFHLDFKPTEDSKQHVLWCREHLRADVQMYMHTYTCFLC